MGRPSPDDPAALEFVGAVGTGWTAATGARLCRQLDDLACDTSPFCEPLPREYARHAHYVRRVRGSRTSTVEPVKAPGETSERQHNS
jgi:bifunctional non-homologous end joining protein LigD